LPEEPVALGQQWSREVDLGAAKGTIQTQFVELKTVSDTPCAILDVNVSATFTGEFAEQFQAEPIHLRCAIATDGSGPQQMSESVTLCEKTESGQRRVERSSEIQLAKRTRIDPSQLTQAQADAARLDRAFDQARADDLEAALKTLATYIEENPQGDWTAAVKNLYGEILRQRVMTKPLPAEELRAVLRDLRHSHDQANIQGNPQEEENIQQAARQIAHTNLETLLEESANTDPIVRELAAFGLTFAEENTARQRLLELTKDTSPSVRAAAAIGLAIQEKPVAPDLLVALLQDSEQHTRGAAALLAYRTVPKGDPQAATLLPLLLENLGARHPWVRAQTAGAIGLLAPSGSTSAVAALLAAHGKETQDAVKPIYLNALQTVTGLQDTDTAAYETWLQQHGGSVKPEEPPPEKGESSQPKG